ncbi:alpha/beta hydrolase [Streptomyces sp. Ru62]|uniref:alpha/beta hydrolase n=1 Tax=Streptomyces sp. Ru62 TaxID=2080745 RepID=UPI000CDD524D|nr:alpha/beta fold hydrolase [Streptomyces sp. Ru62]POX63493.1 alpha/beta hydrolase [Streptomyces sp. Ru62]
MKVEQLLLDGVFVEHVAPDGPAASPPIVFIHGGSHGSWLWDNWTRYFAGLGRHCYAFSWFNHTGSVELPTEEFVKRSMLDATEELGIVVKYAGETPVLVAHSMGAAVAQKYAEDHVVLAQVLLAPVPCTDSRGEAIQIPVDLSLPFPPMPYETAAEWFFDGCSEQDARRYHALMPDESPKAVWEAAQRGAAIELDRTRASGPMLMVAGGRDIVSPAELVRKHAAHFGADYLYLADRAHSLILEPRWRDVADRIDSWLAHAAW